MGDRESLDRLVRDESAGDGENRDFTASVVTYGEEFVAKQLDVSRVAATATEALTERDALAVNIEDAKELFTAHRNVEARAVARELDRCGGSSLVFDINQSGGDKRRTTELIRINRDRRDQLVDSVDIPTVVREDEVTDSVAIGAFGLGNEGELAIVDCESIASEVGDGKVPIGRFGDEMGVRGVLTGGMRTASDSGDDLFSVFDDITAEVVNDVDVAVRHLEVTGADAERVDEGERITELAVD